MGNEALKQQLDHSIETPTTPSPANGTAETAASGDLCSAVARWLHEECVPTWRFTTSTRALWREFCTWSGLECTQDEFAAGLERRGFVVDRGMVEGLALNDDFLAAIVYERERLQNKKAVQLDLFKPRETGLAGVVKTGCNLARSLLSARVIENEGGPMADHDEQHGMRMTELEQGQHEKQRDVAEIDGRTITTANKSLGHPFLDWMAETLPRHMEQGETLFISSSTGDFRIEGTKAKTVTPQPGECPCKRAER